MVEIGPRPAGSPAIEKTRDYIRKELTAAGLKVEDQAFDAKTPLGIVRMVNLRATLPGHRGPRSSTPPGQAASSSAATTTRSW